MKAEEINKIIGVEESYQASTKLLSILLSEKKNDLLKKFSDFPLQDDFFNIYYQEEHSDRVKNKQDYTPQNVGALLNKLVGKSKTFLDMCAGTGTLSVQHWNRDKNAYFYCEEYSERAIPFLLCNLVLRNVDGIVYWINSLTRETKKIFKLIKSDKFSEIKIINEFKEEKAEAVVMNPPYSYRWNPDKEMLTDERFKDFKILAPKSKADFAFLLTGLNKLDEDGTMTILLPHGVLFRGSAEEKIRTKLLNLNYIDSIIGLPDKLFYNTAIQTVIIVLKKNKKDKNILFIDAKDECEKKGPFNILKYDKILNVYQTRKEVNKFSHVATTSEIKENDYNLNIPRYVDTFEEETVPELKDIFESMKEIQEKIYKNDTKLLDMMDELEYTNSPKETEQLKKFIKYWRQHS